uniref:Uncharacterized protein n=1 Tax=Coturnix japonica TaxID=93934 RepID=A0A8C2TH55_COTJA
MGSRAFSHDSIFIPDGRTESEQAIQAMSQENVLGKVKTLQTNHRITESQNYLGWKGPQGSCSSNPPA